MHLPCPVCRDTGLATEIDSRSGLQIDACPTCHGLWLEEGELRRLNAGGSLKEKFGRAGTAHDVETFHLATRRRSCPRCRVRLEEVLYEDVTLDRCGQCRGTWLDEQELGRVLKHHRRGAQGDARVQEELDGPAEAPRGSVFDALLGFFRR